MEVEFLYQYGLFLAKTATVVIAVAVIVAVVLSAKQKAKKGELEFNDLSEDYADLTADLQQQLLDKKAFKAWTKNQKQKDEPKERLFVLDFNGSMDAHEVEALREEVTAVLAVATETDEVLIRLESPGGVVHGYGLAASQLDRIKQQNIRLTVAVDKVAASGGYMMACIADRILAAPFAIVGSIGVVAQLPNFHKLLKKNHIDVEQFTAGEFKRTVTVFAENTDKGREKFQQELEQTHILFKDFVFKHRPVLVMDQVATGEHWFGYQALDLNLIDQLQTSDDYLVQQFKTKKVVQVKYQLKRKLAEKVGLAASSALTASLNKLSQLSFWR
ncbi:ClpP class periplasmic serine protease [Rheinheimera sp. A13L]|uniref:protease SohB n=1 Tax=Rheinheimera sp. A13L TaxID=506534 RepID=UPI0002124A1E|nr:protease SohB [Rheinheimera sp. A13L]EGM78494.1 ClpP class periplasmic serine protease [Rheinheimera sp. A13L]